jgi:hypothetical protein
MPRLNEATRAAAYRASGRRGYDPAAAAYSSAEHARKEREAYTLAESIRRRHFPNIPPLPMLGFLE